MASKTETQTCVEKNDAHAPQTALSLANGYMAVPDGYRVQSLEAFQPVPDRVRAEIVVSDVASLAAYLARFETSASLAVSSVRDSKIRVQIDNDDHEGATPSHKTHSATFVARFSPAYLKWRAAHGNRMSQRDAGEFLEDRGMDVYDPDPATLFDILMKFDALKTVKFTQHTRLRDGNIQFGYVEEDEVRGAVKLPERILVNIPVYEGQDRQNVEIRLRYRVNADDKKLTFTFVIHDKDELERSSFDACAAELRSLRPHLLILNA